MIDRSWQRAACGGLLLGALTGCGPDTGTTTDEATTGDGTTGDAPTTASDPTTPTDADPTTVGDSDATVSLAENRAVDVLFVIDNSGSMGMAQGRLSASIGAFVDGLTAARANYRIGVTTTDSGNPRCPSAMFTPEGGNLVLSSCLDRVDQGEFVNAEEDFSFACSDFCTTRDADLEVKPTTTDYDPQAAPRRWVESNEGQSNIAGVADDVAALQCYLPQGVAGCGFESHLESMYLALAKSGSKDSASNYGFIRDDAQLAVILVTDETDCSYAPQFKDIFTTNKVYWNSPDDASPTSAVCWHAGVACSGGPGTYSECHAENHDSAGTPGASDAEAVLQPISKYIDFVKNIEAQKQVIDANQRVKVAVIGGVPVGYEDFLTEIPYEDTLDTQTQDNFGIGPGCVLDEATAVPPVREREFAEAFVGDPTQRRNLYSICAPDYSQTLATIAEEIADGIAPMCVPKCVADTGPDTPILEPSCTVVEEDLEGTETELAACIEVGGVWTPPAGQTLCYGTRVDPGNASPSKLDDLSPQCVDGGFNLELVIVRTAPKGPHAFLSASCKLSDNKAKDCPLL